MINKDSVVTAYDEHLTLVEWLQKVEKALDNAVLTNLGIAKLSDQGNIATYQVTATFADNTTIVSDTFTFPSTGIVTAFNNLTTLVNGFDTRISNNEEDIVETSNRIGHNEDDIQDINRKMLKLPNTPPTTSKVVTIDTNGAQDNVDSTSLTTLIGNIVDSNGNHRFIEGNITMETIEGITQTYGKWSLSGTHLMIVIEFDVRNTTILESATFATFTLPEFIFNKITTLYRDIVESKTFEGYADDYTKQAMIVHLIKRAGTIAMAKGGSTLTLTANRSFRFQYDLLINNE